MTDFILVVSISLILAVAITVIVKEKRKGNKCIGCPHSCNCHKNKKECSD